MSLLLSYSLQLRLLTSPQRSWIASRFHCAISISIVLRKRWHMSNDMVLSYAVIILLLLCLHGAIGDRLRPSQSAGDVVHSVQDPKYKIEFHSIDSPVLPTPEQETIMMTDRDGRKFQCNLPLPESTHDVKEEQQNGSSIGLTADDRSTRKTPEDLLEALKEKCFRRFEGWWIYELCYKTRLRQFHIHDKKAPVSTYGPDTQHGSVVYFFTLVRHPTRIPYNEQNIRSHRKLLVQEFVLGTFDEEATAALHQESPNVSLQKDPRSQSAAQRYHAHVYTNGTICDLTDQRRETEVRFVCSETGRALINSIKEAPTCKYTVIFHAPMLCKHPSFQGERQPWVVIDCNEMESDDSLSSGNLNSDTYEPIEVSHTSDDVEIANS